MKCSYIGCTNAQTQMNPDVSFFGFPSTNPNLREWIVRSGAKKVTRFSKLCTVHFDPSDMIYNNGRFRQLKRGSLPFDRNGRENLKQQAQAVRQLTYGYVAYDGPHVCQLCRRRPCSLETDQVKWCFANNGSATADTAVADLLNLHFWFKLEPTRDAVSYVCLPCWAKANDFHSFYMEVQAVCQVPVEVKLETEDPIAVAQQFGPKTQIADDHSYSQTVADIKLEEPPVIIVKSIDSILKTTPIEVAAPPQAANIDDDISLLMPIVKLEVGPGPAAELPPPAFATTNTIFLPDPTAPIVAAPSAAPFASLANTDDPEIAQIAAIAKYFTLKCDLCAEPVRDLHEAREHNQMRHQLPNGHMSCKCGKIFKDHARMLAHCDYHADPTQWKCRVCCLCFVLPRGLRWHLRLKHPQQQREAVGATIYDMLRQDDVLIGEYFEFGCDVCAEQEQLTVQFETVREWSEHHRAVHGRPGKKVCCNKVFRDKYEMLSHCKWHRNPHEFRCPICQLDFTSRFKLNAHRDKEHPVASDSLGRRFECYRCHWPTNSHGKLRSHLLTQHPQTEHCCSRCPAVFPTAKRLRRHIANQHSRHQCPRCGKWLRLPSLSQHLSLCGAQPVQCPQCPLVAANAIALAAHRSRLHAAQTHVCPVCGKQVAKGNYAKHMQRHHGKHYECDWCPRKFTARCTLNRHRWTVHRELDVAARQATAVEELRQRNEWRAVRRQLRAENVEADGGGGEAAEEEEEEVELPVVPEPTWTRWKQKRRFPCHLCPLVKRTRFLLNLHLEEHADAPLRYKCDFCEKRFRLPTCMCKHRRQMHPEQDRQRAADKRAAKEREQAEWMAAKQQQQALNDDGGGDVIEPAAAMEAAAMAAEEAETATTTVDDGLMWNFCEVEDEVMSFELV